MYRRLFSLTDAQVLEFGSSISGELDGHILAMFVIKNYVQPSLSAFHPKDPWTRLCDFQGCGKSWCTSRKGSGTAQEE